MELTQGSGRVLNGIGISYVCEISRAVCVNRLFLNAENGKEQIAEKIRKASSARVLTPAGRLTVRPRAVYR